MTSGDGFDEFYQSAFGRLVGQVYLVTGDLGDAEDAVQEAFARASARWSKVRDFNVPEHWVRRMATNLALDGLRRARRRLAAFARLGPSPVVAPISVERVALAEALRTLPHGYRQVIVLHHLLELPVEQVARELGIPTGTAKARLSRGRRALAKWLDSAAEEVATQRWISWGQSRPSRPRRQPPGPVPQGRQRPGVAARPVYHRLEDRIRAHVILCWLALLLVRVAETTTGATWPTLRHDLDRLHVGTFTSPTGTFRQRTDLTKAQTDILAKLQLPPPKQVIELATHPDPGRQPP